MIKVAILGYGYWGPNLLRNFSSLDDCQVKTVVDLSDTNLAKIKKTHPSVQVTRDAEDVFCDSELDALIIATPVSTHYRLCKQALVAGKHVLVEKPMTTSVDDAEDLVNTALKEKKCLMVDHTFLYSGAVQRIKKMVSEGGIGDIQYFDSTRINLGLFQQDINVIWDLAPHDISILLHLVQENPESVVATGISHTRNAVENIAYVTVRFPTQLIAHFHCSWSSPVKIRRVLIGGTKKMILYDDIEPTEKVKVYDTGFKLSDKEKFLIDYRVGDVFAPKLSQHEALGEVARDFLRSISEGSEPVSNWRTGLAIVRILEAAERSIKSGGRVERIDGPRQH